MAFYDEALEEQRAKAAAGMGLELDKRGPGDIATIFVLAFWYVGDIRSNGHVQLLGTAFTNCHAVGVWLHAIMGMFVTCGLYALRSQMLYQVFQLNQPCRGLRFFMPTIVYSIVIIAYGIVSQSLDESVITFYYPPLDLCSGGRAYKATVLALIWAAVLYCSVMYWRIRNIRSSFNESREMAIVSSFSLAALVISTIIQYLQPSFALIFRLRVPMTVISQFCINATWWSILAVPIYNCLFNRQKYLLKWRAKLREDGLQREYQADSSSGMQPISDAVAPGLSTLYTDKVPNTRDFYYGNESGARLYAPITYADTNAIIGHEAPSAISNSCSDSVVASDGSGRRLV
ncbi:hypothetical protein EV174_001577 [Coemansia sp. RSA 2320]|nr:hypothetical protein EV174_001577 [Coemansia sp. RSA 2320]